MDDLKQSTTSDSVKTDCPPKIEAGKQTPADAIDKDDPHKVEKLSKLGHAGDDAAEGTE